MKRLLILVSILLMFALFTSLLAFAATDAGKGSAPIAENLDLTTYRGVSIGGRLAAKDPEGGSVSFQITTPPSKGRIDLDDDGHFVYTPNDGKRGKDYFGYKAMDSDGNLSQEATVIIRIQKQPSKLSYTDTLGDPGAYAAIRLAEEDIFTGEKLAGEYVFHPEEPVTRQEFLAMCMKLSGMETLNNVRSTGFADDREIDAWARPYVATALRSGIVSGYAEDGSAVVFDPERPVTVLEAAVILDRCIELTDAVTTWFGYEDYLPAWALQSAGNVSSCGLLPYGVSFADETISRGEVAEMLVAAMAILEKR